MKHFALAMIAAILLLAGPAEARGRHHHRHHHQRHVAAAVPPECNVIMPCDFGMSIFQPTKAVEKINKRNRNAKADAFFSNPFQQVASAAIGRPSRYIAGRLICAINLNSALAERGIRGTGSALAHSFDHWGVRSAVPVPGAVAVTDRRGGGHVALISRVEGGRVFAWNPSSRGRGWREVEYTGRHARYRVAG